MNKALLHGMDLIPERGEVIVDPPPLFGAVETVGQKTDHPQKVSQSPRVFCAPQKEMAIVVLPPQPTKQIVSIPHLPKFKAIAVIRGDIRAMGYHFASSGRHSELWIHDGLSHIAAVHRSDKKTSIFGRDAHMGVTSYLLEIQRRGVSLTQATDIVCNELRQ